MSSIKNKKNQTNKNRFIFDEYSLNVNLFLLNIIFKAVENKRENVIYSKEKHHELARKIAGECMVLLKNEENFGLY